MVPAFSCGDGDGMSGFYVLAAGWMGALAGDPRWFANPLFIAIFVHALILRSLPSRGALLLAALLAIVAAALAIGAVVAPASGCPMGDYVGRATGLAPGGVTWVVAVTGLSVIYLGKLSAFALEAYFAGRRRQRHW